MTSSGERISGSTSFSSGSATPIAICWTGRSAIAAATVGMFGLFFVGSFVLLPFIGQDFFPTVDAGQFRLHVRAPAGTRIEETERLFNDVENVIRQTFRPKSWT